MSDVNDVSKDWPAEAENDDLLRLAEQLREAAPPLPAEALARVEERMQAELDAAPRPARWRRVALGWSIAASIALAIGGYAYFRGRNANPMAIPDAPPPIVIDDRIAVAVGQVAAITDEKKPLVPLDEYRSLFTD